MCCVPSQDTLQAILFWSNEDDHNISVISILEGRFFVLFVLLFVDFFPLLLLLLLLFRTCIFFLHFLYLL